MAEHHGRGGGDGDEGGGASAAAGVCRVVRRYPATESTGASGANYEEVSLGLTGASGVGCVEREREKEWPRCRTSRAVVI